MIPERPTCPSCPHITHAGQPCRTRTVSGPASNRGNHESRIVTECDCPALTLIEGNAP